MCIRVFFRALERRGHALGMAMCQGVNRCCFFSSCVEMVVANIALASSAFAIPKTYPQNYIPNAIQNYTPKVPNTYTHDHIPNTYPHLSSRLHAKYLSSKLHIKIPILEKTYQIPILKTTLASFATADTQPMPPWRGYRKA